MMTPKDLEIVAELAGQCLMTESDAEENDCVDGRNECFDAIQRVWAEVSRLESLMNTAEDNEPNECLNDIAIEEANKAMNKTNRIADWIYAGREVALIVGGVVLIGTIFYLSFSVFWLLK